MKKTLADCISYLNVGFIKPTRNPVSYYNINLMFLLLTCSNLVFLIMRHQQMMLPNLGTELWILEQRNGLGFYLHWNRKNLLTYSEPNFNSPCGFTVLCSHLEETCLPPLILLSKSGQSQGNRNGDSGSCKWTIRGYKWSLPNWCLCCNSCSTTMSYFGT